MSVSKIEPHLENIIRRNIMPITITTNTNPCNYVFVNKTNQIASLYIKMGQKIQSKKHKNMKSCSNLQISDDSSKNNITNNSLKLSNYSMIKNLKTNNISGYITNRAQNNEQKMPTKQNYLIHVNLNRNHTSNFTLSTKNNDSKNKRIKYHKNKNIISVNNSELYHSIYSLSTRNNFYKQKEDYLNLKKIKNNMKTKKFKLPFNERKKNRYISTSFCNLNTKNINKTVQKSEYKYISNKLSKNRIISGLNNEKKYQHSRYNTMNIDEKNYNDRLFKKNNILKQKMLTSKSKNLVNYKNNSVLSLKKSGIKGTLDDALFKTKNEEKSNYHIKNNLSTNSNKLLINYNQILSKEKSDIPKKNKEIKDNNKNKIKKGNNTLIERRVNLDKKELLQKIKNKLDAKKTIPTKNTQRKTDKKKNNEKIKEFSKIIVLDEYKNKKTSVNFYNKLNGNLKKENIEFLNKTKRDNIKRRKNKFIFNNSKSKDGIKIEKIDSFKPKKIKNNSIINDSVEKNLENFYLNDNSTKGKNIIEFSNRFNSTCFPFPLINNKKNNYKKPIIKITTNNNSSFNKNVLEKNSNICLNKNNCDKNGSNSLVINNSDIISIKQNDLLLKDKNLIIKKKKNIANNSFHINKKLMCYSSRASNNINNTIEIKNKLFDLDNLEIFPEYYDEKFDDLYSVVRKINFGSVLIGAESLFSFSSKKYKEFQYNFDIAFIKKFNKPNLNIEEYKGKYVKKINNSFSSKTDFSSSNKNFHNLNNNFIIPNEFEMSELI